MKRIFFIVMSIVVMQQALWGQSDSVLVEPTDTVQSGYFTDSVRNIIGLNVFPALNIIGGGQMTPAKMFIQYKRFYRRMNLRASINYINKYRSHDYIEILGIKHDTVGEASARTVVDSIVTRQSMYNIYTYDGRFGVEAAFTRDRYRFYVGGGVIAGYHYVGEKYCHRNQPFNEFPTQLPVQPDNSDIVGSRETHFLKVGADITIGIDFYVAKNCTMAIQYAPEFVYFYKAKQVLNNDSDGYFKNNLESSFSFIPEHIDLTINISF